METGGASGGGSINIFYNSGTISNFTYNSDGGRGQGDSKSKGGDGGNGTISVGSIATGSFVRDTI